MTAIPVSLVVPGAQVNVYINNTWRGAATLGAASGSVPISERLQADHDAVTARQELCGVISAAFQAVARRRLAGQELAHVPPRSPAHRPGVVQRHQQLERRHPHPGLPGHPAERPCHQRPGRVGSKIYVGSSVPGVGQGGGTLYRINVATGTVEDQFSFVTPAGQGSEQGETGIGCTPAVTGGNVYFSGLDGKIRCLSANTFQVVWTTDLRHPDLARNQPVSNPAAETWTSPLVVNGRVYVGAGVGEPDPGAFGFIYCLNAGIRRSDLALLH